MRNYGWDNTNKEMSVKIRPMSNRLSIIPETEFEVEYLKSFANKTNIVIVKSGSSISEFISLDIKSKLNSDENEMILTES